MSDAPPSLPPNNSWLGKFGEVRLWCFKHGAVVTKKEKPKRRETHLLLDGGKLCIPDASAEEFYAKYAEACFTKWEWLYVVEMKTEPFFTMMAEVDFKYERALDESEILAVVREMQASLASTCPATMDRRCVILTAPPDINKTDKYVKTGIHVIWRGLPVDLETANIFRTSMRLRLELAEKECRVPKPLESWSATLDPAIFEKNGLRMIRSRKAGICPECKGKSAEANREQGKGAPSTTIFCSTCQNHGKIDLGRPYDIFCAADQDGRVDSERTEALKREPLELVRSTSIRFTAQQAPTGVTKVMLDPILASQMKRERDRERSSGRKINIQATVTAAAGSVITPSSSFLSPPTSTPRRRMPLNDIPPTDEKFKAISMLIKGKPGQPELTHLKQTAIGDMYFANTSCKFCPNKGSEHATSTNFFVVRVTGLERRCYSRKPEVRAGKKFCSEWSSEREELPLNVAQVLFSRNAIDKRRTVILLDRGQSAIISAPPPRGSGVKRPLPDISPGPFDEGSSSSCPAVMYSDAAMAVAPSPYQAEITAAEFLKRIDRQGGFRLPRPITPSSSSSNLQPPSSPAPPKKRQKKSKAKVQKSATSDDEGSEDGSPRQTCYSGVSELFIVDEAKDEDKL